MAENKVAVCIALKRGRRKRAGTTLRTDRVMSAPQRLKLGHDCTLHCGVDGAGCVLEEERIAIGIAADGQSVDSGIEWLAPASGFMRRATAV